MNAYRNDGPLIAFYNENVNHMTCIEKVVQIQLKSAPVSQPPFRSFMFYPYRFLAVTTPMFRIIPIYYLSITFSIINRLVALRTDDYHLRPSSICNKRIHRLRKEPSSSKPLRAPLQNVNASHIVFQSSSVSCFILVAIILLSSYTYYV